MLVQIFKVGEEKVITTLPVGNHVVGRGSILQCNDKRISRNHATIEVTQDSINITSKHINPSFLKLADSKTITILKKDSTTELNDGDTFALLPDDFWFKIKIVNEVETIDVQNEAICVKIPKRLSSHDEENTPIKKQKIEQVNSNGTNHLFVEDDPSEVQCETSDNHLNLQVAESTDTTDQISKKETPELTKEYTESAAQEGLLDITTDNVTAAGQEDSVTKTPEAEGDNSNPKEIPEAEGDTSNPTETREAEGDNSNHTETPEAEGDNSNPAETPEAEGDNSNPAETPEAEGETSNPTASTARREKCWYGAACYRKNPAHRTEFAHPGDSDFESDSNDDRPTCSYGAECYRKNKEHREKFKHPSRQPPGKNKRNRKKVDRLNAATSQEMREFSDSDEDPFVVSDDSDEFAADSEDDDSDWSESQEVDEDSPNIKRLLKESKRFVKK